MMAWFFGFSRKESNEPLSRATKIPREESGCSQSTNGNIAAIDFGTSSVSVAYISEGDRIEKGVNTLALEYSSSSTVTRSPNAILLLKEGTECKIVAFGETAQKRFSTLKEGERPHHIYFERIKMLMKRDNAISRFSTVESMTGGVFYLVEVVSFILKHLKETLIDHLSRTKIPLQATDFDWVITVPAIWDARGKRMMREAAYLAGLLSEGCGITSFTPVSSYSAPICPIECDSDRLSLALEPEAAAIYSQIVTAQEFVDAESQSVFETKSYVVLDIGGGTIDITAHTEIDGGVQVTSIPSGNTMGGNTVNEQFSFLLQDIVDDVDFKQFIDENGLQGKCILNKLIYKEFERQKQAFGNGKITEISVDLPSQIMKFYKESKIKEGAKQIEGVDFDDDCLYINQEVIEKKIFGPSLEAIIESIKEVLLHLEQNIQTIYLVGGYGGSKYIYQKLKAALQLPHVRHYNIIVPTSPALAVVQGGVMWRKNPQIIKARRADATYGIRIYQDFERSKHDSHYKVYNKEEKRHRCDNVFSVFLQKGEIIESDNVFKTVVVPSFQHTTIMKLTIYSTPNLGVQYTVDKDGQPLVKKIGELIIDVPNPDNIPREERDVEIQMDFSGTEIKAKAKYVVNGKEVKAVCDFLSAQL